MSSQKDIKHIDWTIHSVACVMHKWCDLGMLGVKNLGVEISDDAQSTARYSKQILLSHEHFCESLPPVNVVVTPPPPPRIPMA